MRWKPEDDKLLTERAAAGDSLSQIADEFGISVEAARARARMLGVDVTRESEQCLRSKIADMPALEAVEVLLHAIEQLESALEFASEDLIDGLSKYESRIIRILQAHKGGAVDRASIMNAVYFDRVDQDNVPHFRIIDVFLARIKDKSPSIAANIKTVWGVGYRWEEQKA